MKAFYPLSILISIFFLTCTSDDIFISKEEALQFEWKARIGTFILEDKSILRESNLECRWIDAKFNPDHSLFWLDFEKSANGCQENLNTGEIGTWKIDQSDNLHIKLPMADEPDSLHLNILKFDFKLIPNTVVMELHLYLPLPENAPANAREYFVIFNRSIE